MNRVIASIIFFYALSLFVPQSASADTFGTGLNSFDIEFVNIGDPGNAADTASDPNPPAPNPAGSVDYAYRMGKFEISEDMIDKANAEGGLGITKDTLGVDKPATSVTWNEAARFVNWLNTSSGSTPAYNFALQPGDVGYSANADIELWDSGDAGYNPNNLYRNSKARYFVPSVDEWYKAAYYDPSANGGSGGYWNYPTGSDSAPTDVGSGTAAGTAVYNGQSGPADITLAGGLSPYGTMGQGGNVWEWEETDLDLVNDSSSSPRGFRGGDWLIDSSILLSSTRNWGVFPNPSSQNFNLGFRVASVPEPSTLLLAALGLAAGLLARRRLNTLQRLGQCS
jgi:hypothetical protein